MAEDNETLEAQKVENDDRPRNYYVVEFRKRGRQPTTREMDVVYYKWLVPDKGIHAYCYFPTNPLERKSSQDLNKRLYQKLEPNPEWQRWTVMIRGRSGK